MARPAEARRIIISTIRPLVAEPMVTPRYISPVTSRLTWIVPTDPTVTLATLELLQLVEIGRPIESQDCRVIPNMETGRSSRRKLTGRGSMFLNRMSLCMSGEERLRPCASKYTPIRTGPKSEDRQSPHRIRPAWDRTNHPSLGPIRPFAYY